MKYAALTFASLLCAVSTPAAAQDVTPTNDVASGWSVTGGVTLVSDYRFRGISFSDEDPAIQGTINLEHESGFYVGTWASSIEDSPTFGHTEVDLYAGYGFDLAERTSLDVGLLYYVYPNGDDAFGNSDYFEPYASITHAIGPAEITVGAAYAWDQSAIGNDDNIYVYTGASTGIPNTPFSVSAHLGYSDGSLAPTGDYLDWSIGVSAVRGPLTFGVSYVDTDLASAPNVDAGVVFSIGVSF